MPEMAAESHRLLRESARQKFGKNELPPVCILYCGSIEPDNVSGPMAQRELDGALVGGNESNCGFVFGPRDLLIAVSNHLSVMAELANGFEDDFDKKPIVPGHGQCPADSPPASGASMCSQALNRRGGQIAFRGTRGDPYRRQRFDFLTRRKIKVARRRGLAACCGPEQAKGFTPHSAELPRGAQPAFLTSI